jgi:hypothetical protein
VDHRVALGILFVAALPAAAVVFGLLLRRRFGVEVLARHNEVAGFIPFRGITRVEPEAFEQLQKILDVWGKPGAGRNQ